MRPSRFSHASNTLLSSYIFRPQTILHPGPQAKQKDKAAVATLIQLLRASRVPLSTITTDIGANFYRNHLHSNLRNVSTITIHTSMFCNYNHMRRNLSAFTRTNILRKTDFSSQNLLQGRCNSAASLLSEHLESPNASLSSSSSSLASLSSLFTHFPFDSSPSSRFYRRKNRSLLPISFTISSFAVHSPLRTFASTRSQKNFVKKKLKKTTGVQSNDNVSNSPMLNQRSRHRKSHGDDIISRSQKKLEQRQQKEDATRGQRLTLIAGNKIVLQEGRDITVKELAGLIGLKVSDLVHVAQESLGLTLEKTDENKEEKAAFLLSSDVVELIAEELKLQVEKVQPEVHQVHRTVITDPHVLANFPTRPPIITVMGHVDHGKTTLLDYLRNSNVASKELGGITQSIGSFLVPLQNAQGKTLFSTFLDTPGHEAFTTMRASGANVTDIVILVVAADDGIMPQTIEACNHAKAAGSSIIVAINKVDIPGVDIKRVYTDLVGLLNLHVEQLGGDVQCIEISAKTGHNVNALIEAILLQSEIMDLRADPNAPGEAIVVESTVDKKLGKISKCVVRWGTFRVGDDIVAGTTYGKVRALIGPAHIHLEGSDGEHRTKLITEHVQTAPPSYPITIVGLKENPETGTDVIAVESEKKARAIVEYRMTHKAQVNEKKRQNEASVDGVENLNLILKAKTQGSLEALLGCIEKLPQDRLKVRILHSGIGQITYSDTALAAASNGFVVGFAVTPNSEAKAYAKEKRVSMFAHGLIHEIVNKIESTMEKRLAPTSETRVLGRAKVLQVFMIDDGKHVVAGCKVESGVISKSHRTRLLRTRDAASESLEGENQNIDYEDEDQGDDIVVCQERIKSLKHFKEEVRTIEKGMECGIQLSNNWKDIKVGDFIESFDVVDLTKGREVNDDEDDTDDDNV